MPRQFRRTDLLLAASRAKRAGLVDITQVGSYDTLRTNIWGTHLPRIPVVTLDQDGIWLDGRKITPRQAAKALGLPTT